MVFPNKINVKAVTNKIYKCVLFINTSVLYNCIYYFLGFMYFLHDPAKTVVQF